LDSIRQVVELVAALAKRPSTVYDAKRQTLEDNKSTYSRSLDEYHKLDKRGKMEQENSYLDNVESFIQICAQLIGVEQEGHCPTPFDSVEALDAHLSRPQETMEELRYTTDTVHYIL
jgi:hypothetical protein